MTGKPLPWRLAQGNNDDVTRVAPYMERAAKRGQRSGKAALAMAAAVGNVREHASGTALGVEKSSGQLVTVAAATDEMTRSVAEISSQVSAASQVAREAVGGADSSQQSVKGLAAATARIGDQQF